MTTPTKHEWRKAEKALYLPGPKPELTHVPEFAFLTIKGEGNPNSPEFGDYIQALYAGSYAIKMSLKKTVLGKQHGDYTIYPLEGVWDVSDKAKQSGSDVLDKDELVFTLMIRQPDWVPADFVAERIAEARNKKPIPLLDQLSFETIAEGAAVQMLHRGSYDDEPASFAQMQQFAEAQNLRRLSKTHREIYLSDFRKTAPDKLKTVLRFQVEQV